MAGEPAIEVRTVAGQLLVDPSDRVIGRALRRDGVWELAETRFLLATLLPGQTFVDVGAHLGYFSVLAARRVGPTGSVIAVEPEPRNLRLLRQNLARNGCTNAAVLDRPRRGRRGGLQRRGGRQAVEERRANKLLWWVEAASHISAGRYEHALALLDRLLAVDVATLPAEGPAYDERIFGEFTHEARGVCLFRLGRYDEAAAAYERAARLDPGNLAYRSKRLVAESRRR